MAAAGCTNATKMYSVAGYLDSTIIATGYNGSGLKPCITVSTDGGASIARATNIPTHTFTYPY